MANKGKCWGTSIMTEATWEDFHSEPTLRLMNGGWWRNNMTKGGVACFDARVLKDVLPNLSAFEIAIHHRIFKFREGYYGWMGFGGSVF